MIFLARARSGRLAASALATAAVLLLGGVASATAFPFVPPIVEACLAGGSDAEECLALGEALDVAFDGGVQPGLSLFDIGSDVRAPEDGTVGMCRRDRAPTALTSAVCSRVEAPRIPPTAASKCVSDPRSCLNGQ